MKSFQNMIFQNKYSIILIESSFSIRRHFARIFNATKQLILVGAATSENKTRQILQSFLPSILLCNADFISKGFLTWLAPYFSDQDLNLIIYGKDLNQIGSIQSVKNIIKTDKVDFLFIKNNEDESEIEKFCLSITKLISGYASKNKDKPLIEHPADIIKSKDHPLATKIIAIGSSAGGPRILKAILSKFSPNIKAAIIVVQHIPESFSGSLVQSISNSTTLKVNEVKDEMPLLNGNIYIAPGGKNMEIVRYKHGGMCILKALTPLDNMSSSINHMMLSLPLVYGKNIVGIILTGMGRDGTLGMQAIKNSGGKTIVQDKETSLIFEMPGSVINKECVDYILPFTKIPEEACKLLPL